MQTTGKRLSDNGSNIFFWWLLAELAGYALTTAFASGARPASCSWICFSERELLIYLGLAFGIWVVLVQLIVGLALTSHYLRAGMSPAGAGTTAYFGTVLIAAVIGGVLLAASR